MKKSVLFLINGLGIEKAGSYSIAIDQCMPNLSRTKETSYFTTAVINSLEYRSAYRSFYLGDTYKLELNYIKEHIINESVVNNPVYQKIKENLNVEGSKLHIFVEPTNAKIVETINDLANILDLAKDKNIYLHLVLTQQSINEYKKLINIVNYIKFHSNEHTTVGFVIGKELIGDEYTKDESDMLKKLFFFCSGERWTETEKKLISLQESKVRPCEAPGFCATNDCTINNNDVILFFNTTRTNYDNYLNIIYDNANEMLKVDNFNIPTYSLVRLDSKYAIEPLSESIVYSNSLAQMMKDNNKKTLIVAEDKYIKYINFLVNGLTYVNNPDIQFMRIDNEYLNNPVNIQNIIDNSNYDLIIFDYHMMVDKTVNDLKLNLEVIDKVLGLIADTCVNKHSLFITSLYGLKKELPLADYNSEKVTLNYEMQIPIFFFDYTYPRSKYFFAPGETNDILMTAINCITGNDKYYSLIKTKGIINNLFGKK